MATAAASALPKRVMPTPRQKTGNELLIEMLIVEIIDVRHRLAGAERWKAALEDQLRLVRIGRGGRI